MLCAKSFTCRLCDEELIHEQNSAETFEIGDLIYFQCLHGKIAIRENRA